MISLRRALALALVVATAACSSPLQPAEPGVIRDGDVVSGSGTIRYFTIEGGFFAIRGDDDVTYDPLNLPDAFKQEELRVRFRARLRHDMGSIHQAGPIVEVLEIQKE